MCWYYSMGGTYGEEEMLTTNCLSSSKEGIYMHFLWINDFETITVYLCRLSQSSFKLSGLIKFSI